MIRSDDPGTGMALSMLRPTPPGEVDLDRGARTCPHFVTTHVVTPDRRRASSSTPPHRPARRAGRRPPTAEIRSPSSATAVPDYRRSRRRARSPATAAPSGPRRRRGRRHGRGHQDHRLPAGRPGVGLPVRRARCGARSAAGRTGPADPWWMPPDQLDAAGRDQRSRCCASSPRWPATSARCSPRPTPSSRRTSASPTAQVGVMLAAVRVGALLALVIAAIADRRGRRRVLLWSAVGRLRRDRHRGARPRPGGARRQPDRRPRVLDRLVLVISIIAVEEMPAGSRAFAVSVLTATGALGAGVRGRARDRRRPRPVRPGGSCSSCRWPPLPVVARLGRQIPETRRFTASTDRHRARRRGRRWRHPRRDRPGPAAAAVGVGPGAVRCSCCRRRRSSTSTCAPSGASRPARSPCSRSSPTRPAASASWSGASWPTAGAGG